MNCGTRSAPHHAESRLVARVSLNDTLVEVAPHTTLQDALPQWNPDGSKCVIAINREFVPRTDYAQIILQDGDEIDLVKPVWGG